MTRRSLCTLALLAAACLPRPPDWDPNGGQTDDSAEPVGRIKIEPSEDVELSEVVIGCKTDQQVDVSNVGQGPLVVSEVYVQDQVDGLRVDLDGGAGDLPWTLEAGDELVLGRIVYEPTEPSDSGMLGKLMVLSDDPEDGEFKLVVNGSSSEAPRETEDFAAGARPMDVLFTVDHAGSTLDEVAQLEAGFWDFAAALYGYGIDYRIMAVTQLDGCVSTETKWIDDSYGEGGATGVFSAMLAEQAANATEGEQGLKRAKNALSSDNLGTDGCNEGFRRDDAMLHVIGFSDEADGDAKNWKQYVQDLEPLTAWPYETVFSAIGEPAGKCGGTSGEGYLGFIEAVDHTDGIFHSLCDTGWGGQLAELGRQLMDRADRTTYELEGEFDETTLQVMVSSQVLSDDDWEYQAHTNTLYLDGSVTSLGDHVAISYQGTVVCE